MACKGDCPDVGQHWPKLEEQGNKGLNFSILQSSFL